MCPGFHSALIGILMVGLMGCVDSQGQLTASWRLADGRDCQTSGIDRIRVEAKRGGVVEGAETFPCVDTGPGQAVSLGTLDEGVYLITVNGRSPQGGLLYQGQTLIEVCGDTKADVGLVFKGGVELPARVY